MPLPPEIAGLKMARAVTLAHRKLSPVIPAPPSRSRAAARAGRLGSDPTG
jgi:hypothetical protein